MPKCPSFGNDAASPDYRRKQVEPKSDQRGRSVTATIGQWYWMILCPSCDAILGTVEDSR